MNTPLVLKILLWTEGTVLLLAIPFVVLPFAWMAAINAEMGLGELPQAAIVAYLTRSLSALYATWGPVHIYVAADVYRYARLIVFLAWIKGVFGSSMLVLDLCIGMPLAWTLGEGPGIIAFAILQGWLARRVIADESARSAVAKQP